MISIVIPSYNYKSGMRYYDFYTQYTEVGGSKKDGFVNCTCPFDDNHDAKRSSNCGVDLNTGVFNCYKCGTFSPPRFLEKLLKIPFTEATAIVDEYRREHKINEKIETFIRARIKDPRLDKLYARSQEVDLSTIAMATEYAEGRGIHIDTLKELGVGYLEAQNTSWRKDSLVFPYIVGGSVVGIRYRDVDGAKGGEKNCHFTLWGIDSLDSELKVAVVVEGESDRIRTHQELRLAGFHCVVVSTPTATFRQEWSREFEGYHKVVLIHQEDEAALTMIEQFRKAMGNRGAVLNLPWKRKQLGKDVCDWLNYNSGAELALRLETLVGDNSRRFMSGSEFAEQADKPRQFLINNLLARRQVAVMAGPPKNFKTWLALGMIRCVITGEEFCGIPDMNGVGSGKVLFVEEEGDAEELYQRLKLVMGDIPWQDKVIIGHHMGVRLDEESWVSQLEDVIEKHNIDMVVLDPLQRMHGGDENNATEMGPVWSGLHRLTTRFKHIGIVILHHFNKAGDINMGWNALRGSSRTAGEADLGIFVQRRPKSEGPGTKVKFDGRTIPYLETPDGSDLFKFKFDDHRGLVFDTGVTQIDRRSAFEIECEQVGSWSVQEAAKFFGTSTVTIRSWAEKSNKVKLESQGSGKPTLLKWVG